MHKHLRIFYFKGRDEIYESSWFAYNSLAFIMDRDKPRTTLSTVSLYII